MRSADCKGLSRRLGRINEISAIIVTAEKGDASILEVTAKRDSPLLQSNDLRTSKKILKREL